MKVFVLGHKGMLGRYVYTYLKSKKYEVIGVSRPTIDAAKITHAKLKAVNLHKNDVVINCIGIIKRTDVPKSDFATVNAAFPHVLASICEKVGAKLIHVTTDCVYDGYEGNYDEEHWHTAKDLYGMSKSVGEPENATVIRTSIIGEEIGQARSLVEWIKSNRGNLVKGYTNHFWNGITCLQFAKVCEDIIEENLFWKGVKHITSPTMISKYDLVRLISGIYDLDVAVTPYEATPRCDRTLTSTRTDVIFKDIPDLKDQVIEMKKFYSKLKKEKI
jgi:dTDP-4-dehydrorhamnose reductase